MPPCNKEKKSNVCYKKKEADLYIKKKHCMIHVHKFWGRKTILTGPARAVVSWDGGEETKWRTGEF